MKASLSEFEAIGLALAGYTSWVLADVSLKILGASVLPVYEVLACVGFAVVCLMLIYGLGRGNLAMLRPRSLSRQLVRSCLDLANGVGVIVALRHLPLAVFYILIFVSPMATTLLAAFLLKEPLKWGTGLAVLSGFLGVVLVVNPFGTHHAGDRTGYVACLVCVAAFSANMVWSRVITQSETVESLTLFSGVVMAVFGSIAMLHEAVVPSVKLITVMAATGMFCVVGSLCFFLALKHAAAATVSQYHYSQLLTGALIAYVVWHETLTPTMFAGGAIIISSGWYTAARSYRNRKFIQPALRRAT